MYIQEEEEEEMHKISKFFNFRNNYNQDNGFV